MTWTVDAGVQVQNLITGTQQIGTRMTGGGWTLYDNVANAPVYSSVNNQGVTQYLQITQGGTYQYIQFQGWQSWNASTHVGTNGSGTSIHRLYFAGSAQGATVTVDLYMSVTANRVIIFINGVANWRSWGYFGGLGSLAGTNDPICVWISTSTETNSIGPTGVSGNILEGYSSTSLWIAGTYATVATYGNGGGGNAAAVGSITTQQTVPADSNKIVIFPILVLSDTATLWRGDLDGLFFAPAGGTFGHLDTVTISGVTYLLILPNGVPSGSSATIPLIAATSQTGIGMAIVEA